MQPVTNWGRYPSINAEVISERCTKQILSMLQENNSIIARGNGRCYGDSSLNTTIFSTRRLNRFLDFNRPENTITCESGVLLGEILEVIVPQGFFLPVTPGTKFVSVGGAIAADVHGKNHHEDGCFAEHIFSFELLRENQTVTCSRIKNSDLFWQTCGGMGLTGIILSATLILRPIETSYISKSTIQCADLERVFYAFEKNEKLHLLGSLDRLLSQKEDR